MQPPRFKGLFAATLTPMKADGNIDLGKIGPLVDRLIARGVNGLYVCGSTGEGVSMTTAERKAVTDESVRAASGRVPVLVQVGHNSLNEAAELAAHAAEVGAAGISATCPSYFKIGAADVLVESMQVVAAGAPELPFYYYHIPSLTGNRISMIEFLRRGAEKIPNLVGMKFTATELHEFHHCLSFEGGRFEILWGVDEMLLSAFTVGCKAAVGSTYNLASPLYQRLITAFTNRDVNAARAEQLRSVEFISIVCDYPFHGALKKIIELQGLSLGPCRLPQKSLSSEQAASLEKRLDAIGFFDWSN